MAPWEVNDTTSPSRVLPTANAATKLMKVRGSLTAGGGTDRFLWDWSGPWPAGLPGPGREPLDIAAWPDAVSVLALALLGGAPSWLQCAWRHPALGVVAVQRFFDRLVDR
jgi:hypothetical protein